MKKLTLLLLSVGYMLTANAQKEKYIKAMEKNIAAIDTSKTQESLLKVSNNFERVAGVEKAAWLPFYYTAYTTILVGMWDKKTDKQDEYYDKAIAICSKLDSLTPNNSEILTLKAFALQMKLSLNPMVRGRQLGPECGVLLEKAIAADANNPRPYFLKGQSAMYTPAMFGGGKDKALPLLEKSVSLYASFKPASSIAPVWGENQAKESLEKCKQP